MPTLNKLQLWLIERWVALTVLLGSIAIPALAFVILQWVFIPVWGRYGYWIWANGGSSSGSW